MCKLGVTVSMICCLQIVVILVMAALQVCCWSVTGAGKVALRQQRGAADNKTGPVQEGGGRGGDCPSLISVKYCPNTKEGNFSFRAGFTYSFLPVNFEVNGVQIDRDCHCYNSSAEMLIVDLDRTIGGDNYTFLLSWSYPQCNNRYKGRFEDGQLYMEDGIEVEKKDDDECIIEDGTGTASNDTGTDDLNSACHSVPGYLCLVVPIIALFSTILWL